MKYNILIFLAFVLFCACNQKQRTENVAKETIAKETMKKLAGEWVVMNSWSDTTLTFKNKKDKNYAQEIFPSYNTIIFNTKTSLVEVNTYGEFGCGTAATENLNMQGTKWIITNGRLHIKGKYSDYTGQNDINNVYEIKRNGETLTLTKIK